MKHTTNPISNTIFTILLIACTTLPFITSQAQEIETSYLSISDGLASPTVNDVMQDTFGLLWIATTNGLQLYDGYHIETYKNVLGKPTTLQSNETWRIAEDADRNIWVTNALGVSKFDRIKNEFINYPLARIFNMAAEGGRAFKILIDSKNLVWVVTQNLELVVYDPKTKEWTQAKYEVPDVAQPNHQGFSMAITEDAAGGLWFGSTNYNLMHRAPNGDTFKPIPIDKFGGINSGNSDNRISALYADTTGTIWITTRLGVYKYNSKTEKLTTIKEYSEAQLDIWNNLNCILPDDEGNIWIANNYRGILKFEGLSDSYQEINITGKVYMRDHGWNITLTDFIIDHSGIFWFGSREQGLLKYDPVNKPFTHLAHNDKDPLSISPNGVYGIMASKVKPGIVYVGTRGGGLNIYDPKKQTFEKVRYDVIDDMFEGSVRSIAENSDGTLWLGTWGDGLIKLDNNYNEVTRFKYEPNSTSSISNNQVRVIRPDRDGLIWVGTNNGLNIFNPQTGNFQRVESELTQGYSSKLIRQIEQLAETNNRMGIIDHVVNFQNLSQPIEIETPGTYFVMSVGEGDPNGMVDFGWIENAAKDTLWHFGTFDDSYFAGGAAKNRIAIDTIFLQPGNYNLRYVTDDSHSYDNWNEASPDQTGLWGIVLVKPENENQALSMRNMLNESRGALVISGNSITDILPTEKYIWIATNGNGLNRIERATKSVTYFEFDPANENSISSNNIFDICIDKEGMIWIASDEGINKTDSSGAKFTHYSEIDGLPTNLIEAIIEGDSGEMWIATQNGLSQMVTNEALGKITFINYNSSDGLGGEIFLSLAAARATDGRYYFGGDHGLTTFSNINANDTPPELIISDLLISNKSVLLMGDESPLATNLLSTETLELSYQQNNLSFEFAALHYANPQKNQYAHFLQGYDEGWVYDNRNYASYTNLDPGTYEFKIRASNAYGIWNEEGKTIRIVISPPWWKTIWAYAAYTVVFILCIYIFDRVMRRRLIMRERERSREKELAHAREIEKAYKELKATQSQLIQSEKMASLGELTAGIAHEIQNPLNFVNNFSEVNMELLKELKDEIVKGNYDEGKLIASDIFENEEKINHHGKRAETIVKGMLEHSRSGDGKKEPTDINTLADEYLRLAYHGMRAKDKSFNAEFKTEFDENLPKINVITQDIGRVLLNLINNAFYACADRSRIDLTGLGGVSEGNLQGLPYAPIVTVSTKLRSSTLEISVKDNGSGIPDNIKDKIFQPFFTTKPTGQGTGLGLSLSYDIVKAHGGELKVKSPPSLPRRPSSGEVGTENEGTEFTIILSINVN